MRKTISALLAGAMLMMATSAMAIPITGNIGFVGTLNLTGGTTASTATGLDFVSGYTLGGNTGSYATVTDFTPVTFTDFTYKPLTPPVTDLWAFTFGGATYSFDLLTIVATNDPANTLALNGTGLLDITGFDTTAGTWCLTTQDGTSGTLTFSATSAVPEPGTMLLFGIGMLGMAVYGKRRMNKEA